VGNQIPGRGLLDALRDHLPTGGRSAKGVRGFGAQLLIALGRNTPAYRGKNGKTNRGGDSRAQATAEDEPTSPDADAGRRGIPTQSSGPTADTPADDEPASPEADAKLPRIPTQSSGPTADTPAEHRGVER
jgi:hypothetical protein